MARAITMSRAMPTMEYPVVDLRSIKINTGHGVTGKRRIESMTIDGRTVEHTPRFSISLAAQCGFSENIFKFFDHAEVFDRIIERGFADNYRVALDVTNEAEPVALAVSKPTRQIIRADDLAHSLRKMGINPQEIEYDKGIVTSRHTPTVVGKRKIIVAGDEMVSRFIAETPIDGYGGPSTYLMLIRLLCTNGAIGYSPAFRAQVNLGTKGKDSDEKALPTWERFMSTYNNEEGFAAMRERFEAAAKSWASIDEFFNLYKLLGTRDMDTMHRDVKDKVTDATEIINPNVSHYNSDINRKMREIAGDVTKMYGVVSMDSMSPKQRRKIPTGASLYDLLNVATELASHRATTAQSRKIQAWVGGTLQGEYDLEGTRNDDEPAQDLFLHDKNAIAGLNN